MMCSQRLRFAPRWAASLAVLAWLGTTPLSAWPDAGCGTPCLPNRSAGAEAATASASGGKPRRIVVVQKSASSFLSPGLDPKIEAELPDLGSPRPEQWASKPLAPEIELELWPHVRLIPVPPSDDILLHRLNGPLG